MKKKLIIFAIILFVIIKENTKLMSIAQVKTSLAEQTEDMVVKYYYYI